MLFDGSVIALFVSFLMQASPRFYFHSMEGESKKKVEEDDEIVMDHHDLRTTIASYCGKILESVKFCILDKHVANFFFFFLLPKPYSL